MEILTICLFSQVHCAGLQYVGCAKFERSQLRRDLKRKTDSRIKDNKVEREQKKRAHQIQCMMHGDCWVK